MKFWNTIKGLSRVINLIGWTIEDTEMKLRWAIPKDTTSGLQGYQKGTKQAL